MFFVFILVLFIVVGRCLCRRDSKQIRGSIIYRDKVPSLFFADFYANIGIRTTKNWPPLSSITISYSSSPFTLLTAVSMCFFARNLPKSYSWDTIPGYHMCWPLIAESRKIGRVSPIEKIHFPINELSTFAQTNWNYPPSFYTSDLQPYTDSSRPNLQLNSGFGCGGGDSHTFCDGCGSAQCHSGRRAGLSSWLYR